MNDTRVLKRTGLGSPVVLLCLFPMERFGRCLDLWVYIFLWVGESVNMVLLWRVMVQLSSWWVS